MYIYIYIYIYRERERFWIVFSSYRGHVHRQTRRHVNGETAKRRRRRRTGQASRGSDREAEAEACSRCSDGLEGLPNGDAVARVVLSQMHPRFAVSKEMSHNIALRPVFALILDAHDL